MLVLGITTQRTLKKGLSTWKMESAAAAVAAANPSTVDTLLSADDKSLASSPCVYASPSLEGVRFALADGVTEDVALDAETRRTDIGIGHIRKGAHRVKRSNRWNYRAR